MATASQRLFSVYGAGATATLYTPPTGHAAIVKTLTAQNATGSALSYFDYLFTPAGVTSHMTILRRLSSFPGNTTDVWSTWFVLMPTDTLGMEQSGANLNLLGFGAVLPFP